MSRRRSLESLLISLRDLQQPEHVPVLQRVSSARFHPQTKMPVAQTRLETLQVCKLLQSISQEDKDQISKLILNGVPHLVNYVEPTHGQAALHVAAAANNEDLIEYLLELGAHPDVVDNKGRSASMHAAEHGHWQCLEKLSLAGADMTLRDLEGKDILFYSIASTDRHKRCTELALHYGANVNNCANNGTPSFVQACETANENEDACMMLLEKGADPNSRAEKSLRTALMAACASGSARVVRALLARGADTSVAMTKKKLSASHEAAKNGHFQVLASLAAYQCVFDVYDDRNENPVHMAAKGGHGPCCKFLIQRGCNPKTKNSEGMQAKAIAKEEGHKEAMKECRKGEKSFGKTGKNNDPWALALYDWAYERKEQLLEVFAKFDADQTDSVPKDDFVEAIQNMGAPMPDEPQLKPFLVAHDKDKTNSVNYKDFLEGKKYINKLYLMSAFEGKKKKKKGGKKGGRKKGKTKIPVPICTKAEGPRAEDGGPPETFIERHIKFTDNTRFDRDKPPEHPLQDDSAWYLNPPEKTYVNINTAAKHGDIDSLKDAVNKGWDLDTLDKYFKSPLMTACMQGNISVVDFLLEKGANVNLHDNFKWTPLHFACHAGQKDIVEKLVDAGANLEAVTLNGATPVMRAIESSKEEVVRFLIERGVKLRIENKKGHNPVDKATDWGDFRVYGCVKAKWDTLPPPSDKKKKGKGGAKGGAKRPASGPPDNSVSSKQPAPLQPKDENIPPRNRKGSILRTASQLAGGIDEQENITYVPKRTWTEQPNSKELIKDRCKRRDQFGWEVDFSDFKMPFRKNVENRTAGMSDDEA